MLLFHHGFCFEKQRLGSYYVRFCRCAGCGVVVKHLTVGDVVYKLGHPSHPHVPHVTRLVRQREFRLRTNGDVVPCGPPWI